MLVCRVIAGRVRPAHDHSRHHASDYDSVDMGNGELVVLDSRAVLPCFLIIYKAHQTTDRAERFVAVGLKGSCHILEKKRFGR
uniref:PARP catalytic domain-containing protein n=1 Tax=Oryza brachyantha TaxID=4533 RepID=J3N4S1_ORYBR